MAENTSIEWATHTFNCWIGCTKIAAGCTHCYAESYAKRYNKAAWGPHGTRVKTSDDYWRKPIKWNREAAANLMAFDELHNAVHRTPPSRPRVFCASLADVFEDWDGPIVNSQGKRLSITEHTGQIFVGEMIGHDRWLTMDDLRRDLFALIDATPHLDWLLLTKRPENIRRMWPAKNPHSAGGWMLYRNNVWLLTSIATQADADRNVPELLKCRDLVPVLGLSCEPLLGPVTLDTLAYGGPPRWLTGEVDHNDPTIDWVIVGGESGHGARPMNPDWARDLRDQCRSSEVPFFMKQMDKKQPIPPDLFVREFPDGIQPA